MREILFRGKTKDSGEWVYGNLKKCEFGSILDEYYISLFDGHNMDLGGYNDGEQMFEVIPETVGQYIGLKDKNNKKIFEGDVLLDTQSGESYVMKWFEKYGCFAFANENRAMEWEYIDIFIEDIKIIGNVFDNPELMKGEYL